MSQGIFPHMTDALLELTSVEVHRAGRTILGPISWQLRPGERWVILGPNGAGKTTMLQLLAALTHPSRGQVKILGEQLGRVDVFDLRTRIGFTSSAMAEILPRDERVMDIVLTAAYAMSGRWQESYDLWDESRAKALLTIFGVRDLGEQSFGTLSEGEKKRVQISRALMADPEILLLDEPAAGLDLGGREDILRRITDFTHQEFSPATVIVTHHLEEIPVGTTHALLLKNGSATYSGPISEVLTSDSIRDVFGIDIELNTLHGRFFATVVS